MGQAQLRAGEREMNPRSLKDWLKLAAGLIIGWLVLVIICI